MKKLITYLKTLWSWGLDSQRKEVGVISGEATIEHPFSTYSAPFGTCWQPSGKLHSVVRCAAMLVMLFTLGVGNAWAVDYETVATFQSSTVVTASSYAVYQNDDWYLSKGGNNISGGFNSSNQTTIGDAFGTGATTTHKGFYIKSKNKLNNISKITFVHTAGSNNGNAKLYLAYSTNGSTWTAVTLTTGSQGMGAGTASTTYTMEFAAIASAYFVIIVSRGSDSSGAFRLDNITATFYRAAAACSTDVTIGTASLNGSFSLSSVGVQCASITPGSNCAVASGDYGFIWYEGTGNKEIGGSGVTRVNNSGAYSSGAFSNSLTSTFVAGTTYTFRAFAINGKPSTAYSAAVSFTPYTVTFNMNGHGSAIAQQVVNTGGTASTPSAPSATGYTFGGWYQEAGCTNAVNWSSTITANKNYYAKWTAKEYTVTLDNESPTVSGSTSVTLTYNSASHAAITNPTKTGYTFAGWWTGDNGTGTEVINTSGALQASVSNYTGAGGIWTRDNNSTTLYAKWTAKSFTVTWMVNGESYSAGGSTSVNFDSHVATLPTAPTPPCGNKFMGWTTTNIGSVGLDKDDDAAAITALNLFTTTGDAPTISAEGNVTYYAVFADYVEK